MAATALPRCLCLYIILLPLATPWVSAVVKDCPHLKCFYNSRANVSCVWSWEETLQFTSCRIHARSDIRHQPSGKSQSLTSADFLNISVMCQAGEGWYRVETCNFRPFENLRLLAPHSLQVLFIETQRCNISWEVSQVSHYIYRELEFEARTRSLGHSWKDAPLLSLKQRQQWICLETLIPDTSYELQVRVRAKRGDLRTWSPWSQPLAFRTRPADLRKEILPILWHRHLLLSLGCVLGFLICVYGLIKCRYLGPRWKLGWGAGGGMKTILKCHVPDPSQFFSQLSSQHGGDLQKWLSSPFPLSSFSPTGPVPEISPLEVLDADSKTMQLILLQQDTAPSPSPSGHSHASCFTNQGYFFFHLPNALEIESCQVYFTYDPCIEEEEEEDGPGLSERASLPSPLPLAGEDDDYCEFPPRDDLLFSPSVRSPNAAASGGVVAPEEKCLPPLQEGLPSLPSPDSVDLQCPLELVLAPDGDELSAHHSGEQASVPESCPCGQGQDRVLGSVLPLDTDAYLSLQELQAQDPAHLV
ncbi:interleukin-2 receptor subunit beta [Sigmodon hispidus]